MRKYDYGETRTTTQHTTTKYENKLVNELRQILICTVVRYRSFPNASVLSLQYVVVYSAHYSTNTQTKCIKCDLTRFTFEI